MTAVLSTAQITLGTAFALAGSFKAFRYDHAKRHRAGSCSVPPFEFGNGGTETCLCRRRDLNPHTLASNGF